MPPTTKASLATPTSGCAGSARASVCAGNRERSGTLSDALATQQCHQRPRRRLRRRPQDARAPPVHPSAPGTGNAPEPSVMLSPRSNATNDEQLLARFDEAEPARLTDQLVAGADGGEAMLQLLVLCAQLRDLRLTAPENGVRVLVGMEGLPVEERDDAEAAEREQSRAREHGADFAPCRRGPLTRSRP